MNDLLLITPTEALAVVLGTVGMYVAMVVLVKVLGQRMLATMSSYDLAAVVAFGAIIGRASLGEVPRLAAGVLALATLILLQAIAGMIRVTRSGHHAVAVPPVLLMAGATVIEENMKRCHVVQHELASRLRQAGVRHRNEVAAVIFEPSGAISVLRRGDGIEPELLEGVRGAEQIPPELLR
ncbi:DUF421 domain-containing protein [Ruania alba]|uniref:Uncharacterized membrane protein YcaP, DUF421 family n=1 Tax=Ruania alba TaxID=648782 RepID=A0A1H5MF32_9MICO|nr:YetF domain-containing protein [Ruania alba]SEE87271.1 Uncharacterized membrane protein YcaP, DUF421 family [Ruania alba]